MVNSTVGKVAGCWEVLEGGYYNHLSQGKVDSTGSVAD